MTKPVKKLLKKMRTDGALILGECPKFSQTSDVFWKKPFKGCAMESYDEWLASGVHYYTEVGSMKPASGHLIVT